jgi:sec-independent protein translocase protein TatA
MFTITHIDWIAWSAVLSGWHVALLLIFALLVFGPKRLPELSRALGRSIKDFKKGMNEIKDDLENADQPKQPPQVSVPPAAPVAPPVPPVVAAAPPAAPPVAPLTAPPVAPLTAPPVAPLAAPPGEQRPAGQQQPPPADWFPSDGDPRKS